MKKELRRRFFTAVCLFLAASFAAGCGRLKGEFAFRDFRDDAYRKIDGVPEFEQSRKINWVFVFKKVRASHRAGVVLLKKELVWVDIDTRVENISKTEKVIYGEIENLSEGRYKIMITEKGDVISEKEFIIFKDEDWSPE